MFKKILMEQLKISFLLFTFFLTTLGSQRRQGRVDIPKNVKKGKITAPFWPVRQSRSGKAGHFIVSVFKPSVLGPLTHKPDLEAA
jgi:hypothetical protein